MLNSFFSVCWCSLALLQIYLKVVTLKTSVCCYPMLSYSKQYVCISKGRGDRCY